MKLDQESVLPGSNDNVTDSQQTQPAQDHVEHEVADPPPQPDPTILSHLHIQSATEFKKIPPPDFMVDGIIPSGVTVLFANPGAGKSFFALAVGTAVARDRPLFEQHETMRSGGVLFILPEGVPSWAERLRAHDQHFGLDDSTNMYFMRGETNLATDQGWRHVLNIVATINNCGGPQVSLVVIDTLAAATPGANENAVEEIGLVMQRLQILAGKRIAVLVCHHAGKSGAFRGHTSISGSCDALIRLVEDKPSGVRELHAEKLRDAGSISSCPFEIIVTDHGPIAVKTTSDSTWSQLHKACDKYPGLLDALLDHGLAIPGCTPASQAEPTFAEGVSARKIHQTLNSAVKYDNRAHCERRRRALLSIIKKLNRAGVLRIKSGHLGKREADVMDAIVVQVDAPSVTVHPPIEEGGDRDS